MPNKKLPVRDEIEAAPRVTARVQSPALQVLNERELQSISNLFAWVAAEQDTAQETVKSMTETRFNVDDVTRLSRKDYDEVIRFLVNLRIDEMRN
jgi:hypothetical protein